MFKSKDSQVIDNIYKKTYECSLKSESESATFLKKNDSTLIKFSDNDWIYKILDPYDDDVDDHQQNGDENIFHLSEISDSSTSASASASTSCNSKENCDDPNDTSRNLNVEKDDHSPLRFKAFLNRPQCFLKYRKPKYFKRSGAGGIIVDLDTERLLVVRGTLKWSLPKGHLEEGEKYHECAMREIKEETNLNITLNITDQHIDVKRCVYYIVGLRGANQIEYFSRDPEEIYEVAWLTPSEIVKLNCNRQLDYVINRWDFILDLVKTRGAPPPLLNPLDGRGNTARF